MMSESVVEHNSKLERTIHLHGISLTDPELDPTAQDAGSIDICDPEGPSQLMRSIPIMPVVCLFPMLEGSRVDMQAE
jgi:hypothetical protein